MNIVEEGTIAVLEKVAFKKRKRSEDELIISGPFESPASKRAIVSSNCGSRSFSARFPLALPGCLPLLCHPDVPALYPVVSPGSSPGIWEVWASLSHQLSLSGSSCHIIFGWSHINRKSFGFIPKLRDLR